MNKRYFLWSFGISFSLILVLFLYVNAFLNRDDPDFKSEFPVIDAEEILDRHSDEDFVVIIISSGCPGKDYFMPRVKADADSLSAAGIPFYIVEDGVLSAEGERPLAGVCSKYELEIPVYHMNPETYPKNGGFFMNKQRYHDFVAELCGTTDGFLWGYAQYIYFRNGHFADQDTYLKEEWGLKRSEI